MPEKLNPIISDIRKQLATLANPERAAQQQAYMKSTMPFAGVGAPELRKLCHETCKAHPPADQAEWLACADQLWRGAQVREERYAAINLLAFPRFQKAWLDPILSGSSPISGRTMTA